MATEEWYSVFGFILINMKAPKSLTEITFQDFQKPTSFNGLIDLVWCTMCENHDYGNYFLGKDQDLETRFKRDIFPPYFKAHAGFNISEITLNDILIIHRKLFDFMEKIKADERREWAAFYRKQAKQNEHQRIIINNYHELTGIPKYVLRQRLKGNPDLKAKAHK